MSLPWVNPILNTLLDRRELSRTQMACLMTGLLSGECPPATIGAILIALRMKEETAEELATAAAVIRDRSRPLETGRDLFLDTCGTGGDDSGTFNISTATALVVAGAGVPVVKHGNRGVSSKSGSADVLAALGVSIGVEAEQARRCLDRAGMAFCLAPLYHPALSQVAEVRRELGVRTLFNCLGPLLNPARAPYQLLGVGRREWLDRMAAAAGQLGTTRTLLVHAVDGLDEVSLAGPTLVRDVQGNKVTALEWTAEDFGLPRCAIEDLRVSGPTESAAMIRSILQGEDGPPRRIVLANAAAALFVVGRVATLKQGAELAAQAIDTGKARAVLDALIECTRPG